MAMRLYPREEFYAELRRLGFEETTSKSEAHTIWLDKEGEPISIPHHADQIPDHILDTILETSKKQYKQECVEQKKYHLKTVS